MSAEEPSIAVEELPREPQARPTRRTHRAESELWRRVKEEVALGVDGRPIILTNFHRCGAEVGVTFGLFDGATWLRQFVALEPERGLPVLVCPRCGELLRTEEVSALEPDLARLMRPISAGFSASMLERGQTKEAR